MMFGIHAVMEAIRSGVELDKVLIKRGMKSELLHELIKNLQEHQTPYQYVPIERINRITRKNHQGVLAFKALLSYQNIELLMPGWYEQSQIPLVVVLDQLSDVRNFGAIARTAECAGAQAIIIPQKGAAQINPDAMKTSAGALNHIAVCRVNNMKKNLVFLKESGLQIVAASEKAQKNYYEIDCRQPTAILMGAEDKGIQPELLRLADHIVSIPIYGKVESLNVSVATAVLLYEAVRQRQ